MPRNGNQRRNLVAIEQHEDAIVIPVGQYTKAVVQPSEYEGEQFVFIGQRRPRNGVSDTDEGEFNISAGMANLTPEVLRAAVGMADMVWGEGWRSDLDLGTAVRKAAKATEAPKTSGRGRTRTSAAKS